MNFLFTDGPIIAASTCSNANAALAVLRISGFNELSPYRRFFSITGPIEPRRVYYSKLKNEDLVLDDICLTFFEAPRSFNGENILELSIHGNTLNTERVLNLFINQGLCRQARPGEFTYRALKNKKLNLSQVEGLDLLLNAQSGHALDQGLSLLSGNLQQVYSELFELFLKHKSALELSIDFIEDVGEKAASEVFQTTLNAFKLRLESLYHRVLPMAHNLIQPEIVLAGLPNSGKSSLFNYLLRQERAIVSSVAGTTRDFLSEFIVIGDVRYKLIDTAGIRDTEDAIEAEGVRRSKEKLKSSFFRILLINPFEMSPDFSELVTEDFDLTVFTHADCEGFEIAKLKFITNYPQFGSIGAVSLVINQSAFENVLYMEVNKKYLYVVSSKPILLDRHKSLITQCWLLLQNYEKLSTYESDVAVLSHELNTLTSCLSELIGIISPDQVLNSIFSNFCIGK
jgi:tRNA modification GTPase